MPNTTGEVVWSCNVTAIENEREKCESLLFRKERLVYTRSITLLGRSYFAWHRLGGDHVDGMCTEYLKQKVGSAIYRNFSIPLCTSFSYFHCLTYTILRP